MFAGRGAHKLWITCLRVMDNVCIINLMEPQSNMKVIIFSVLVSVLFAGGIGFYIGKGEGIKIGSEKGYADGYAKGITAGEQKVRDEIAALEQQKAEDAAKAVNPFSASTNPFEGATNPFEEVKINPFK